MKTLAKRVREAVEPLLGSPRDYDSLLDLVGNARFVLLGEATHGTQTGRGGDVPNRLVDQM